MNLECRILSEKEESMFFSFIHRMKSRMYVHGIKFVGTAEHGEKRGRRLTIRGSVRSQYR